MSSAAKPVRPSKRDVIVIDDCESDSDQPAAKNVKIEEEPVTSSEVVELQQRVLKLEDDLQRAYSATRTAEVRAEEAESRLDSMCGIKDDFHAEKKRADDLKKRLTEVLSELLEARRIVAENADTVNTELVRENESLKTAQVEAKKAHQDRLAEVSSQLDGARRRADGVFITKTELAGENEDLKTEMTELKRFISELALENEELKGELEELRRSIGTNRSESIDGEQQERLRYLTDQLEKEQRQVNENRTRYRTRVNELLKKLEKQDSRMDDESRRASEDQARYRARIYELEQKLLGNEDLLGSDLQLASENPARIDEPVHKLAQYERDAEPVEIDHSGNILQLCRPDSSNSISYEIAREKLHFLALQFEGETLDKKLVLLQKCLTRIPELKPLFKNLECELCKVPVNKSVLTHFFGKGHKKMVRTHGVTVSRAALEFWLGKLNPDAQSMQQQWPRDRCINQLQLPTSAAATGSPLAAAAAAWQQPPVNASEPHRIAAADSVQQPVSAAVASRRRRKSRKKR